MPTWLWVCQAQLTAPPLAVTDVCTYAENIKCYICMSVFNQRSVTNVSSCLSWFLSLLSLWVFICPVCPWHWQEAAGVIHVMQWCVQSWGRYSTFPFGRHWPSTLKARYCLSSEAVNSQCNRTDIDRETHSSQSVYFTFCVWAVVKNSVRAGQISSLKHFYFPFLLALQFTI